MKTKRIFKFIALGMILTVPSALAAEAITADEIMQKNFLASKVLKAKETMTMSLINANGEKRERALLSVSKLQGNGIDSNFLVRFLKPADVKGTGFLKIEHSNKDDDQWIYLPALNKSRRLVANNKKDSFMGSDFSYGDISLPRVNLYTHKLIKEESFEGTPCYVIESIPANENVKRDYGYGKKVSWIGKNSFHELKIEYYDSTLKPLKTQILRGITEVDATNHRWHAEYREMTNHQTQHKTVSKSEKYDTQEAVGDDIFTTRALESE